LSGFSNDGQWWWEGTRWIATPQIVLPDLPMTDFERSGKLRTARDRMRKRGWLLGATLIDGNLGPSVFSLISLPLAVPYLVLRHRAFRDYRLWTLEQLALTASYLPGPDDPMLPARQQCFPLYLLGLAHRELAVVVTVAHVLILRIDSLEGQPRGVLLAARPNEVRIDLSSGPFSYNPTLLVSHETGRWAITGDQRVFQPEPVLAAWRKAASSLSRSA